MRNAKKRPAFEVADIIKKYGDQYRSTGKVPAHHLRVLSAIERCRTAELGGHINVCLSLHPHVHAIVPAGGLHRAGQWVHPKKGLRKAGFLLLPPQ